MANNLSYWVVTAVVILATVWLVTGTLFVFGII